LKTTGRFLERRSLSVGLTPPLLPRAFLARVMAACKKPLRAGGHFL
jgi:hypothetical protein